MNNLRGVALEEKVMKYIVNSCEKKRRSAQLMNFLNLISYKMRKNDIKQKKEKK